MASWQMPVTLTLVLLIKCAAIAAAGTEQPPTDALSGSDVASAPADGVEGDEAGAQIAPELQSSSSERSAGDSEQVALIPENADVVFGLSFTADGYHDGRNDLDRVNARIGLDRWDRAYERPLDLTALLAGHEHAWGEPGQSLDDVAASMFHHMGNTLPLGITAGLLASERDSSRRAGHVARDSIIATTAATHLLKAVIDSSRPADPTKLDGFPSGHTSMSIAFARAIAGEHATWGAAAYLWAGGVAWSRVHRGDHTTEQVIAGALLGWFIANSTASSSGSGRAEFSVPCDSGVMVPAGSVKW